MVDLTHKNHFIELLGICVCLYNCVSIVFVNYSMFFLLLFIPRLKSNVKHVYAAFCLDCYCSYMHSYLVNGVHISVNVS